MMTRTEPLYMCADEIAAACSVSKAKAYMIIRAENEKLKEQGYLTIAGKLPRRAPQTILRVPDRQRKESGPWQRSRERQRMNAIF